jgi:hypothetical protein
VVLSLAEWLVWPSVTGAVAGHALTDATSCRRVRSAVSGGRLIPYPRRVQTDAEHSHKRPDHLACDADR